MTCPHKTTYNSRCMDCCQRLTEQPKRIVLLDTPAGVKVDGPWFEQQDLEQTLYYFEQRTGRY